MSQWGGTAHISLSHWGLQKRVPPMSHSVCETALGMEHMVVATPQTWNKRSKAEQNQYWWCLCVCLSFCLPAAHLSLYLPTITIKQCKPTLSSIISKTWHYKNRLTWLFWLWTLHEIEVFLGSREKDYQILLLPPHLQEKRLLSASLEVSHFYKGLIGIREVKNIKAKRSKHI